MPALDLGSLLAGAVVLAPMSKGSNLPYRRLCNEMGATLTMGEMAVARNLRRPGHPEHVLLRRSPDERFFGVQLAGREPQEMAAAAALAEERGADLVDVNLGCPIEEITRRGLGAALLRRPAQVRAIVEAMKRAVSVPVTVKIRLGWDERRRNHVEVARAAVDGGADAVFVHGRTRSGRYRNRADWEAIGEVVAAVPVPVVGNGDLLFPRQIEACRRASGCAGVMVGRGALIKPWIFREAARGEALDPSAGERLAVYRRWVELARAHWGDDELGARRMRVFLLWHLGFWRRYAPPRGDGSFPEMQEREGAFVPRSSLEAVLASSEPAVAERLAEALVAGVPLEEGAAAALMPAGAGRAGG